MATEQASDIATLLTRAQHNDGVAYEAIYQRYAGQLQRYLYSRCRNWDLAEELLSDVWLRVVQYLPRFRIPSDGADPAFTRWLYTICHNQLCDAARRSQPPL